MLRDEQPSVALVTLAAQFSCLSSSRLSPAQLVRLGHGGEGTVVVDALRGRGSCLQVLNCFP